MRQSSRKLYFFSHILNVKQCHSVSYSLPILFILKILVISIELPSPVDQLLPGYLRPSEYSSGNSSLSPSTHKSMIIINLVLWQKFL